MSGTSFYKECTAHLFVHYYCLVYCSFLPSVHWKFNMLPLIESVAYLYIKFPCASNLSRLINVSKEFVLL